MKRCQAAASTAAWLSHDATSKVNVMQFKQNTIQILDACGQIIATMALPANIKLTELAPLKILGDISFKVLPGAAPSRGICLGGVV